MRAAKAGLGGRAKRALQAVFCCGWCVIGANSKRKRKTVLGVFFSSGFINNPVRTPAHEGRRTSRLFVILVEFSQKIGEHFEEGAPWARSKARVAFRPFFFNVFGQPG